MSFEIKFEGFSGPLQLLLELIESKKMTITEVSLSAVTEEYLNYLQSHEVPSEELADFLTVASRLILIKSSALLPTAQEQEDDGERLAAQLSLYREFVAASQTIEQLIRAGRFSFPPARPMLAPPTVFALPSNLFATSLADIFNRLLKRLEPFFALREVTMRRIISVEQRMDEIRQALQRRAVGSFKELTSGFRSKVEVIVSFLALLELTKQRLVRLVQPAAFGDIELERIK